MTDFTLRSVFLVAFVLCNCISWSASKHHYGHNASGHRSRHRRQGAGLFLQGTAVVPGGEGSGAWGPWGEDSECSRTCGGGVASRQRICLEVAANGTLGCTGGDRRYFSCNVQDCPDNASDFRAEQCAEFNDQDFQGVKHNWVPYTNAENHCELNCMPRGERFYFRHKLKVVDGTRCTDESLDVCVDGVCQHVGCDMMLGSNEKEDKCRECRGNGTSCRTIEGIVDDQDLTPGYNDLLLIPEGATSILIEEVRPSHNYLAIRSQKFKKYYLNGDYHIDFPRSLTFAGALWHYERNPQGFVAPDRLRCQGPTTEPVYITILLTDVNVGIKYEYSIPASMVRPPNEEYAWVYEQFTPCSASCGGGFQTRNVTCRSRMELTTVDDHLCDELLRPLSNQSCNTEACAPTWVEGPWSPCSKPCGEDGSQSRQVHCEQIISNGRPSIVSDDDCFKLLGPKQDLHRKCNIDANCPTWYTGPWKPCDKLCGEGKQQREVRCYQRNDGRIELLADDDCSDEKPTAEKQCYLHPCEGVDWVLSEWSGCDSCLSKLRTRTAQCVTKSGEVFPESFCATHPVPVLEEDCNQGKLPTCEVQWYATQWSKCSVECGKGVKTRQVFCGQLDGESILKVEDKLCDTTTKYNDTKPCEEKSEKCLAKWFAGPWSACTAACGGGKQFRRTMCFQGSAIVETCAADNIPDGSQSCNTGKCDPDETLPVNVGSTTVIVDLDDYNDDDYSDDCSSEEDYPEEGAELDMEESKETSPESWATTLEDELMLSDSPGTSSDLIGEGSGDFTTITDETGSGDYTDFTTDSPTSLDGETSDKSTNVTSTPSPIIKDTFTGDVSTDLSLATDESTTDSSQTESDSTIVSSLYTEITTYLSEAIDESTTDSSLATGESTTDSSLATDESTMVSSLATDGSSSGLSLATDDSTTDSSLATDKSSTDSSQVTDESTTDSSLATDESTTDSSLATDDSTTGSSLSTDESSADSSQDTKESTTDTSLATDETTTDSSLATDESTTELSQATDESTTELSQATDESTTVLSSSSDGITESISDTSASTASTDESTTELSITDLSTTQSSTDSSPDGSSSSSDEMTESSTYTGSTEPSVTESGSTELTEGGSTLETGSTEEPGTDSSTTEVSSSGSGSTEPSETGSTDESKSSITEGTTESSDSTSSSPTESSTDQSGSSESSTEPSGSTETSSDLTGSTETSSEPSGSTDSSSEPSAITESSSEAPSSTETSSDSSTNTETSSELSSSTDTSSDSSVSTDLTTEQSGTTESTDFSVGSTSWDLETTIKQFTKPKRCRMRRKKPKCMFTKFGCCSDKKTAAAGPFEEGCPHPETCKEALHGCCPDGLSPATGPNNEGCSVLACNETLYGCCKSDNKTAAQGNDQDECPPPPPACKASKFGCCADEKAEATGPKKQGCPETEEKKTTSHPKVEGRVQSPPHGFCKDNQTEATGPNYQGCPCNITQYGCCPDGVSLALGEAHEGCVKTCNDSQYGCCPDGETPAHGRMREGCCLSSPFGCCPDNSVSASGPHFEGCDCEYSPYGCCPDNRTVARGQSNEGCDCKDTEHGCCPDRHTPAVGPKFEGCPCHTYQFGCCFDGKTAAKGPNQQGCRCEETEFGCCGDMQTVAQGPEKAGCDCASSEFGCCPDGRTEAQGEKFLGCTDVPENLQKGCSLAKETGPCSNYTVTWFYDMEYGGCSRFWYGGCDGNLNRFSSQEECQEICVHPKERDACNLPKVKGVCETYNPRWYYDSEYERCGQFVYGGCLGNANNFATFEACEELCQPTRNKDQCSVKIDRGTCSGNFVRWGFNGEVGECEQFIWGGCGGNHNRFPTEAACIQKCDPPGVLKEECSLSSEVGNCTEKEPKWYFDQGENRCVPFYFTGCNGNDNQFDSELDCEARCPRVFDKELCAQPAMTGDCANYEARWYFDTTETRCRQFYYGGCGGNGNNFRSQDECLQRCVDVPTTTTTPATTTSVAVTPAPAPTALTNREPNQDLCNEPSAKGECDNYTVRWYFDPSIERCRQFYYGGCGGNDNNFKLESDCYQRCVSRPTTTVSTAPAPVPDANNFCFTEAQRGPCAGSETRWHYDVRAGRCREFTYGGCGGNYNNFPSQEHCEHYCSGVQDICQLPMLVGPCDGNYMQWFYDATTDACNQFTFGGCQGNGNRFNSREDCESRCRTGTPTTTVTTHQTPAEVTEVPEEHLREECQELPSLDPCGADVPIWHYDPRSVSCIPSMAGNCQLRNKYQSEEECERSCGVFRDLQVCLYPLDAGDCHEAIPKVYWDARSGRCTSFVYGGCGGGPNRFSTVQECESLCAPAPAPTRPEPGTTDLCQLSPEVGPCRASVVRWFYDSGSDACNQFTYGGCQGNDNKFDSREECESRCRRRPQDLPTTQVTHAALPPEPIREECLELPPSWPCGQEAPTWHYDPRSSGCIASMAGNCQVRNKYRSEEECERSCGVFRELEVCRYPLDAGECDQAIPKVFWDAETGRCSQFTYGGCGGGPNRFSTVQECESICAPTSTPEPPRPAPEPETPDCELPVESGNCGSSSASRRWYYSEEYGNCMGFIYTGCGGNTNNFLSYEDCVRSCRKDNDLNNEIEDTCARYRDACSRLKCETGVEQRKTEDGCVRCVCRHPCASRRCADGERCVARAYEDSTTGQRVLVALCSPLVKNGQCPIFPSDPSEACARECNDDVDCEGNDKCCRRGCSNVCVSPQFTTPTETTLTERPTTAYPTRRWSEYPTRPLFVYPPSTQSYPTRPPMIYPTQQPYTNPPSTPEPQGPQAPVLNPETLSEVASEEGGLATLRCLFHGNPPPTITWQRGAITIDGDAGRYRILSDGALQIVSVYRNDSGVYICVGNNGIGRPVRQEVTLQVNDPVVREAGVAGESGSTVIGVLGEPLLLRCAVYGYPAPSIQWWKGRIMVPYISQQYEARDNVLNIRSLDIEALGTYTCHAYNGFGKPAILVLSVKAYRPEGVSADNLFLLDRDVDVAPEERGRDPNALPTLASDDIDPNIYPEAQAPVVYNVPIMTSIPTETTSFPAGSELSLLCEVDGNPAPVVTWSKDGERLNQSDRLQISEAHRLTITEVTVNDSGMYSCHAANAYSSHASYVQINIEGLYIHPNCTDNPFFANCKLIVNAKYCRHQYYAKFCCRSCTEAGQLSAQDMYADDPGFKVWRK